MGRIVFQAEWGGNRGLRFLSFDNERFQWWVEAEWSVDRSGYLRALLLTRATLAFSEKRDGPIAVLAMSLAAVMHQERH